MRKKTIIIAGLAILILLGGLYFMFGRQQASGWDSVKPGSNQSGISQAPSKPQAQNTVTLQVTSLDKPKDVTFKLYKNKEPVAFADLDRVEQKTVNFLADYFNSPAEETVRQLYSRIIRKYSSPKIQDWEIEGAIKSENYYGDKFPVKCERQLLGVFLLPEYYSDEGRFVVPVKIQYLMDGKDKEDVIMVGIARGSDGTETIGQFNNFDWYLKEVTKKYNLNGTEEEKK